MNLDNQNQPKMSVNEIRQSKLTDKEQNLILGEPYIDRNGNECQDVLGRKAAADKSYDRQADFMFVSKLHDRIEALQSENAGLREALKEIVIVGSSYPPDIDDGSYCAEVANAKLVYYDVIQGKEKRQIREHIQGI